MIDHSEFANRPHRKMTDKEGEQHFQNMLHQIRRANPDEIVAVHRSGFSYAMWVAQILRKPLGVYWPRERLVISNDSKSIVFVDDNIMTGTTFKATKELMKAQHPTILWNWAVLFCDWNTSQEVKDEIFYGTELSYFAEEPIWGSRKISLAPGVRFRDEDSV